MTYQFGKKHLKRTLEEDLNFGKNSEKEVLPIIKDFFKDDINFVKYEFSTYDFQGKKNKYELKTRQNYFNSFDTTIISQSKILYNRWKNVIYLFRYIDGLYYIKYDKNLFDTFEIKPYKRNEREDYEDKIKPYCFIPIKNLTKIN
jgi:hypothetical protein